MKFLRYLLLGIFAYIIFMLLLFPASAVVSRLTLDPITLTNVSGPLWNGNIDELKVPNTTLPTGPDNFSVENISWQFAPAALLKGKGALLIEFDAYGGHGSGLVEQRVNGSQAITGLHFEGKGDGISILLDPFVKLDGDLILNVHELVLEKQLLKSLQADFNWNNAVLQIPTFAKLGSITLNIKPKGEAHILTISSEGGELRISGQVEVEMNGNFRSDINIKTQSNTSVALKDMLRAIARPASDGSFRIRRTGNVNRLM